MINCPQVRIKNKLKHVDDTEITLFFKVKPKISFRTIRSCCFFLTLSSRSKSRIIFF